MEEVDIWRSANFLIQQHGPDAIKIAALREVEMLNSGDDEGAQAWQRIILAIDALMLNKAHPSPN